MGFVRGGNETHMDWARRNATHFKGYSSFGENFRAGVSGAINEDLSISRWINDDTLRERNRNIRKARSILGDDIFDTNTSHTIGRGKRVNYGAIAAYANETGQGFEFETDEELIELRNERLADARAEKAEIYSRSLTAGKWGSFLGTTLPTAADPIALGASVLALPLTGAVGASRALYALSAAKRGAAVGAGTAAIVEPTIYAWKEEIDAEYSWKDAMVNITASGILGGTIDGLIGALGKGYIKGGLLNRTRAENVSVLRESGLSEADAENLATFVEEAKNAPDKSASAQEHVERLEETQERMENPPPPPDPKGEGTETASAIEHAEADARADAALDIEFEAIGPDLFVETPPEFATGGLLSQTADVLPDAGPDVDFVPDQILGRHATGEEIVKLYESDLLGSRHEHLTQEIDALERDLNKAVDKGDSQENLDYLRRDLEHRRGELESIEDLQAVKEKGPKPKKPEPEPRKNILDMTDEEFQADIDDGRKAINKEKLERIALRKEEALNKKIDCMTKKGGV